MSTPGECSPNHCLHRSDECPRPTLSPVLNAAHSPPHAHVAPIIPVQPLTSPITLSPKSPTNPLRHAVPPPAIPASNVPHSTTAADLLKDVILGHKNESRFLTPSIWSPSSDEQLKTAAGGSPPKNPYRSPRHYPTDLPQTWSTSFASGSSQFAQQIVPGAVQKTPSLSQTLAQSPQISAMTSSSSNHYQHQRLPSLSSSSYQHYPALNQPELHGPLVYSHLVQAQQQSPLARPAPMNPLTPPSISSSQTMYNPLFNNVIGHVPMTSAAMPLSSSLATGSTSPHYTPGRLPLDHHGHARQASYSQSQHSPHHPHSNRPPNPGQSFASLPQAW